MKLVKIEDDKIADELKKWNLTVAYSENGSLVIVTNNNTDGIMVYVVDNKLMLTTC